MLCQPDFHYKPLKSLGREKAVLMMSLSTTIYLYLGHI